MKHVNVTTGSTQHANSDENMNSLEADMLEKTREIEASAQPEEHVEVDDSTLAANIVEALKDIYDPEIPVNIYDLGLIYRIEIEKGHTDIDMTLTTPGCPVAQSFPGMVEATINKVPGVKGTKVHLVWDPPWTQDQLSEEARLQLGLI